MAAKSDHKGPMRGLEDAAFDKHSDERQWLAWGRGTIKHLKRDFRRRMRRIAGHAARREARADG